MKILAEFLPKSWEMPPGARVLEHSASVITREFDGEKLDWLMALVEIPSLEHPITWIRPLDAYFDAGFVVLGVRSEVPFVITRRYPSDAPDSLLTAMCQHNRLGRCFFFNDKGSLREHEEEATAAVVFAPKGKASWLVGTLADDEDTPVPFLWSKSLTNAEILRLPALKVWKRLQRMLIQPNSNATFARRFAFADARARQEMIFNAVPLEQKEFDVLVRSLILSQDFWSEAKANVEFFVPKNEKPEVIVHLDDELSETPPYLSQNVDLLWQLFEPVRAEVAKHLCVVDWLHRRSNNSNALFSHPTAHEQLEAQLRWREWLRQTQNKLSPRPCAPSGFVLYFSVGVSPAPFRR